MMLSVLSEWSLVRRPTWLYHKEHPGNVLMNNIFDRKPLTILRTEINETIQLPKSWVMV